MVRLAMRTPRTSHDSQLTERERERGREGECVCVCYPCLRARSCGSSNPAAVELFAALLKALYPLQAAELSRSQSVPPQQAQAAVVAGVAFDLRCFGDVLRLPCKPEGRNLKPSAWNLCPECSLGQGLRDCGASRQQRLHDLTAWGVV